MDKRERIEFLADAAQDDVELPDLTPFISTVSGCGGNNKQLKILQTSVCNRDCAYCANRAGRDTARATLSPDELARAYDDMYSRKLVDGLFVSSGIAGNADECQARMIATVELLRKRYAYKGFVHMKILPEASDAAIERTVALADRVSVNIEAPTISCLQALSSSKVLPHLVGELRTAHRLRLNADHYVSMTTQMVVGAGTETDQLVLGAAEPLYKSLKLSRVYYSGFHPILNTPLDNHPRESEKRIVRLYQADRLMKLYDFKPNELIYGETGMLPVGIDPKVAWAKAHPELYPVEINMASRSLLLRVPGIGPVCAERILKARRQGKIKYLSQLKTLGVRTSHAQEYITIDGRRALVQLSFLGWESSIEAGRIESRP